MLHKISKRKAERLPCFRAFGNPMKHDARGFEISQAFPPKQVFFVKSNIFCTPHGCLEAGEICEQALVTESE